MQTLKNSWIRNFQFCLWRWMVICSPGCRVNISTRVEGNSVLVWWEVQTKLFFLARDFYGTKRLSLISIKQNLKYMRIKSVNWQQVNQMGKIIMRSTNIKRTKKKGKNKNCLMRKIRKVHIIKNQRKTSMKVKKMKGQNKIITRINKMGINQDKYQNKLKPKNQVHHWNTFSL